MKRLFFTSSLLLYLVLFVTITTNAQNSNKQSQSISGFVHDNSNGEALVGANIYVPELSYGSTSNIGTLNTETNQQYYQGAQVFQVTNPDGQSNVTNTFETHLIL